MRSAYESASGTDVTLRTLGIFLTGSPYVLWPLHCQSEHTELAHEGGGSELGVSLLVYGVPLSVGWSLEGHCIPHLPVQW